MGAIECVWSVYGLPAVAWVLYPHTNLRLVIAKSSGNEPYRETECLPER